MTVIEACTPAARFRVVWAQELEAELHPAREALSTFPRGGGREPDVVFSVERYAGDGRELYTLRETGGGVRHCLDVNQVISALVGRLNSFHLDHASGLVNLHAAGVAVGGLGVILTGPSGSGKSTLALAAVAAGFDYLSDETVGIDDAGRMSWYPKPITAKGDVWSFVASLIGHPPPEVQRSSARRWEIPAGLLRSGAVTAAAHPVVVLRVTHEPGAEASRRLLDAVAVLGLLVENASDLVRFGPGGLHRLARLAARATGAEVTYRDARQVVQIIEALLAEARPTVVVEELEAAGCARALGPGGLESGDRPARLAPSVVVGDRAVVHRPEFDRLFTLDPVATLAWRQLDGRRSVVEIEAVVSEWAGVAASGVGELLDDLAGLGLLGARAGEETTA